MVFTLGRELESRRQTTDDIISSLESRIRASDDEVAGLRGQIAQDADLRAKLWGMAQARWFTRPGRRLSRSKTGSCKS